MRKTREEKAITLIALIITIVVLLILAVVAINSVTGDGIIQHATNAKTEYEKAQNEENSMISYYQVYLDSEGQVGRWIQNKTKVTRVNSDGTVDELEVGDIVNYESGVESYKDEQGKEKDWAVLGAEDGKVLLVSATNVATETLTGREDYINNTGINRINAIGANYDDGIGAVADSGRSINIDDINRVTGYNPLKTGDGKIFREREIGQYLNKVTYTINSDGKVEYSSAVASGVSTNAAQYQKFMRVENGTELAQGESITVDSNFYEYYPVSLSLDSSTTGEVKGISAESNAYELLFGDTDFYTGNPYWLGSSYINARDGHVYFGVRHVRTGFVGGFLLWGSQSGTISGGRGVRAVVSLKSDVQFTKTGDNTYNISIVNQ